VNPSPPTCTYCHQNPAPGGGWCAVCKRRDEEENAATVDAYLRERTAGLYDARLEASGIPEDLRRWQWSDLVGEVPEEVVDALRRWSEPPRPGEPVRGVVLLGEYGVGKTVAAAVAARERCRVAALRWVQTPHLFVGLASGFGSEEHEQALRVLDGTRALVLDDIDMVRSRAATGERLFAAIDGRCQAGAPLLITTNLELRELAAYLPAPFGDSIASRLAGHCDLFRLKGRDRRLVAVS
jgi:DNA replication protein DnaC